MIIETGMQAANLSAGAGLLNQFLADELVLYIKTKNAHWNVEGPGFYTMHEFFDVQARQLEAMIDQLAERIRSLGHYTRVATHLYPGTMQRLERSVEVYEPATLTSDLLSDHEEMIRQLRENIICFAVELDDAGTSGFITGLMETHEKMAWMLRAQLK